MAELRSTAAVLAGGAVLVAAGIGGGYALDGDGAPAPVGEVVVTVTVDTARGLPVCPAPELWGSGCVFAAVETGT